MRITTLRVLFFVPLLLLLLPHLAGTAAAQGEQTIVFQGATLIDMTGSPPRRDTTVIVRGSRIVSISSTEASDVPPDALVVDVSGKFIIPGLWDMHAHVLGEGTDRLFSMLVANGVTGIRDMSGPMPLAQIQALRTRVAEGEVLGPRFVAPGPLVDGGGRPPGALGPSIVSVSTPQEAREAVRTLKDQGADFIKVYNRLTPELYEAILAEARETGIPVDGHVPLSVDPLVASDAGQRSIEHLSGVMQSASRDGDRLLQLTSEIMRGLIRGERPEPATESALLDARRATFESFEPSLAAAMFARFAANGTWHCATLVSNRVVQLVDSDPRFASDARLAYIPAETRDQWSKASYSRGAGEPGPDLMRARFERQVEAVGAMHQAGVRLLAGSDLGAPYVYAGFSLHDELALMVESGLTPYEALSTATRNPAEFLGMAESLGTVEEGKLADLVVLEANPLEDMANTRLISGVVLNGRYLDQAMLDECLSVAKEQASQ